MKLSTSEIIFGLIGLFVVSKVFGQQTPQQAIAALNAQPITPISATVPTTQLIPYQDATTYSFSGA